MGENLTIGGESEIYWLLALKKHSDSPKRTNKHVSTFQPEFKITNLKVGELFSWMKVALATICPQHIVILQEAGVVMIDMIGKLRDG